MPVEVNALAPQARVEDRPKLPPPDIRRPIAAEARQLESWEEEAVRALDESRWDEAEKKLDLMLEVEERTYGSSHPQVAGTLLAKASIERLPSRKEEAEPLYTRALAILETRLGPRNPYTLMAMRRYAAFLTRSFRHPEADALFRQLLERSIAVHGERHADTIEVMAAMAGNLGSESRIQDAVALYRRALPLSETSLGTSHPRTLGIMNSLAFFLRTSDLPAAEKLLRQVLERAAGAASRNASVIKAAESNLTDVLARMHRFAEAEEVARRVFARDRTQSPSYDAVTAILNEGERLLRADPSFDMEPLYQQALRLRTEFMGADRWNAVHTVRDYAAYLSMRGRYAEAAAMYRDAIARAVRGGDFSRSQVLGFRVELANALLDVEEYAEAERIYREAMAEHARPGGAYGGSTYDLPNRYIYTLLHLGRTAEALERARAQNRQDREKLDSIGFTPEDERSRRWSAEERARHAPMLADALWSASRQRGANQAALRAEAFAELQDRSQGETLRSEALAAARKLAAVHDSGLEALARRREELVEQWAVRTVEKNRYFAPLGPAGEREGKTFFERFRADIASIEGEIASIDTRLRRDFPDYFAIVRPQPLSEPDAAAMLDRDEAAVLLVPTAFGTHVVLVTADGDPYWYRAEQPLRQVRADVRALRRNLECQGEECEPFDRAIAFRLYRTLFSPLEDRLAGKRHLYIVADGPLASLPFAALVTRAPRGDDGDYAALRATSWFGDRHAFSQFPSLQSLALQRRTGRTRLALGGFAGFGDPRLDGAAAAGSSTAGEQDRAGPAPQLARRSALLALAPLAHAAAELELLRSALGAPAEAVRTRERATETEVRTADLHSARIIAFATHALLSDEVGVGEPGLVLTPPSAPSPGDDGLLTPSEIVGLRLSAEWLILSACNTGAGDGRGGASLSGLARAFLHAGARSLLVSHWRVRDDVAPLLTVRTVTTRQAHPKMSRAEALQAAMRDLRDDPDQRAFSEPRFWASFFLVGDPVASSGR